MGQKVKILVLLSTSLLMSTSNLFAGQDHSKRHHSPPAASADRNATPASASDDPFDADIYPISHEITGPSPVPTALPVSQAAEAVAANPYPGAAQPLPTNGQPVYMAPNGTAALGQGVQLPTLGRQVIVIRQPQVAQPLGGYGGQPVIAYQMPQTSIVQALPGGQQVLPLANQQVIAYQLANGQIVYAYANPLAAQMPTQYPGAIQPQFIARPPSYGQQAPVQYGQQPVPGASVQPVPRVAAPLQPQHLEPLRERRAPIESIPSKEVLPDAPANTFRGMVLDVRKKKTSPAMKVAGKTGAPIGFVQFCRKHRKDCSDKTASPGIVKLSRALWNEMVAINSFVNGAVEPVTDDELYDVPEKWTYPTAGRGDCEDYVLLKRRLLMERGWPASALLITVVRDERGGHAVLTVRTDQGDFILDNQESKVLAWYQTPYRYIKRQSESEAKRWVSIRDERPFNIGSLRK